MYEHVKVYVERGEREWILSSGKPVVGSKSKKYQE